MTVDLNTGSVNVIAQLDFNRPVYALACDAQGQLYAAGSPSNDSSQTVIYTVDKVTGEYEEFMTIAGAGVVTGNNYYGNMRTILRWRMTMVRTDCISMQHTAHRGLSMQAAL